MDIELTLSYELTGLGKKEFIQVINKIYNFGHTIGFSLLAYDIM